MNPPFHQPPPPQSMESLRLPPLNFNPPHLQSNLQCVLPPISPSRQSYPALHLNLHGAPLLPSPSHFSPTPSQSTRSTITIPSSPPSPSVALPPAPLEHMKPVQQLHPVQPTQPVQTVQPMQPVQTVQPMQPAQPLSPQTYSIYPPPQNFRASRSSSTTSTLAPIRKTVYTGIGSTTRDVYACPFYACSRISTEHSNMKAHMRLHTGERPYVCRHPSCRKTFRWKSSLTYHERALHPVESLDPVQSSIRSTPTRQSRSPSADIPLPVATSPSALKRRPAMRRVAGTSAKINNAFHRKERLDMGQDWGTRKFVVPGKLHDPRQQ